MSVLKIKDNQGNWQDIPAIKGEQGIQGVQGPQGIQGPAGQNATINGVNTLTLTAGDNITLSQSGNELEISATIPDIDNNYTYFNSSNDPFVLDNAKKGVYWCNSSKNQPFYIRCKNITYQHANILVQYIYLYEDFETADYGLIGHFIFYNTSSTKNGGIGIGWVRKVNDTTGYSFTPGTVFTEYVLTSQTQTIYGSKTFDIIPQQSNTNAPTDNKHFTNKKYVDDQISNALGTIETTLGGI